MKDKESGILRASLASKGTTRLKHREPTGAEMQIPTELPELSDFAFELYPARPAINVGERS
jgi:hypothetical protein